MKKHPIITQAVLLLILYWQIAFGQSQSAIKVAERECKRMPFNYQPARLQATQQYGGSGLNMDVTYARTRWNIDPSVDSISGSVITRFKAIQPLDTFSLDLHDNMSVDSVFYHGIRTPNFSHNNNRIKVALPQTLSAGSTDSVTVYYSGSPTGSGFGSFKQTTHNGDPVIWTLSEPYGAYEWWPCKNSLTDKYDSVDLYTTVPVGNKVAGNGLLIVRNIGTTHQEYHWKHRYPIAAYLICMAATNYSEFSDTAHLTHGPLPVLNYIYPENLDTSRKYEPGVLKALKLYDSLFVPYPYYKEKYGHAQFGWGGGMEHQTMSFMVYLDYDLMAHELAHQWFGDLVTCRSFADIWLNEGFATYLTGLNRDFHANNYSFLDWKRDLVTDITGLPGGSVYVKDTTNINGIFDNRTTYNKGAMFLHILRKHIGDSAFFAGLRNYLKEKAYNYATSSDLKRHLEASSGQALDTLFRQWLYGEGYPSYRMTWQQDGTGATRAKLTQLASVGNSVRFFTLRVPIRFNGSGRDTTVYAFNTDSVQTFNFQIPFPIRSAEIDPEYNLVRKILGVTGLSKASEQDGITIVPNPANSYFHIQANPELYPNLRAELYNVLGERVRIFSPKVGKAESLDGLPSGIYHLQLHSNGLTFNKLIIKN